MNRVFPGAEGGGPEERRAAEIFGAARSADLVIDLHEEGLAWPDADMPTLVTNDEAAGIVLDALDALAPRGFAVAGGSPEGSLCAELGRIGKAAITIEVPMRLPPEERLKLHLLALRVIFETLGMRR